MNIEEINAKGEEIYAKIKEIKEEINKFINIEDVDDSEYMELMEWKRIFDSSFRFGI